MARRPRNSCASEIYHVIMRGNNRKDIFSSERDYNRFCLLMQEGVTRFDHRIYAFCLMRNHVHLAIRQGNVPISKICQNIAFRYSRYYNDRHKLIGHLFQGRFKSILVRGRIYLRQLIRYIHLNPVRAKIIEYPEQFTWSSHLAYIGQQDISWLSRDEGLQFYDDDPQAALEYYRYFVGAGIGKAEEIDFDTGLKGVLVGNDDDMEDSDTSLTRLFSILSEKYGLSMQSFSSLGSDRRSARIRAISAHLVRSVGGIDIQKLAKVYSLPENTLSRAALRLELDMKKSNELMEEITALKSKLLLEISK